MLNAMSRATIEPSESRRTMKGSAVVAIGVCRGTVGRDDDLPADLPLRKAEKEHYSESP